MAEEFLDMCYKGDLEGVQAALQSGVDVNSQDSSNGQTGLMRALMLERTAVGILLLGQEGIDVNILARGGETALHEAARHNKTSECLAMLLARPDLTTSVNQKGKPSSTKSDVFRHARVSSTYPSKSVSPLVGWSYFRISNCQRLWSPYVKS